MRGTGFGVRAAIAASRRRSGVSPASRSGARPAKRSSAPTRRGTLRSASSASAPNTRDTSLNVLHSSSRASSRSRSSHSASSSSRSTSVRPGQQAAGLELDERGGDEQELGGDVEVELLHALDLGQVGVDDAGQADLVDVDLLGQDQLQEQVERTLVGPVGELGGDIDRHRPATLLATPPPVADVRRRLIRVSAAVPSPHANTPGAGNTRMGMVRAVTRVLSCIQPTGDVHLGNYLGALRNWVDGPARGRRLPRHRRPPRPDGHRGAGRRRPAHGRAGGDAVRRRARPRRRPRCSCRATFPSTASWRG